MTWKLDDSLTCPACLHYNALSPIRIGVARFNYECRDCGYVYESGTRCGAPVFTQPCILKAGHEGCHISEYTKHNYTRGEV